MNLYAIRRRNAWESAEELEKVGARSKEVGDTEFPGNLAWIRTYVVKDEDGITAMEYGLLAAAIAGVLILVAFFFSNRLGNAINNVSAHIN